MDKDFDFSQIPHHWALCYVSECPRKQECMRYQACLQLPKGTIRRPCILPSVLQRKQCPQFHPIQKIRVALGFRYIFNRVLAKDIAEMRSEMAAFLGSHTTYYRYRNGEYQLTPRQQDWICQLFRRYGYTHDIVFDDYKDVYVYSD